MPAIRDLAASAVKKLTAEKIAVACCPWRCRRRTILFRTGGDRSLPPSGRSAGTLVCDGGGRRPREARQGDWAGPFTADHKTRGYGWPAVLLGNSATGERRFIRTARVSPSSRYG